MLLKGRLKALHNNYELRSIYNIVNVCTWNLRTVSLSSRIVQPSFYVRQKRFQSKYSLSGFFTLCKLDQVAALCRHSTKVPHL